MDVPFGAAALMILFLGVIGQQVTYPRVNNSWALGIPAGAGQPRLTGAAGVPPGDDG